MTTREYIFHGTTLFSQAHFRVFDLPSSDNDNRLFNIPFSIYIFNIFRDGKRRRAHEHVKRVDLNLIYQWFAKNLDLASGNIKRVLRKRVVLCLLFSLTSHIFTFFLWYAQSTQNALFAFRLLLVFIILRIIYAVFYAINSPLILHMTRITVLDQ